MTDKPDENVENDYEYSKRTYYDLIEKGQNALDDMIDVARNLEHPRAYEVLSGMIKNVSDVNDRLMDLNKKKKDFYKNDTKQIEGNTTISLPSPGAAVMIVSDGSEWHVM